MDEVEEQDDEAGRLIAGPKSPAKKPTTATGGVSWRCHKAGVAAGKPVAKGDLVTLRYIMKSFAGRKLGGNTSGPAVSQRLRLVAVFEALT